MGFRSSVYTSRVRVAISPRLTHESRSVGSAAALFHGLCLYCAIDHVLPPSVHMNCVHRKDGRWRRVAVAAVWDLQEGWRCHFGHVDVAERPRVPLAGFGGGS
jgi:hypothetical protein